ncbi:hypothetical protein [Dysgonomonas alginatilytica]|uniref:hypothetical protein n=1 Tax=Dysgonomonas alginatilytica TaxID=1605892 RepID=UPI0011B408F2|nr:hypothetical protein [Dysgonomonas alginatilytica]
MNGCLTPEVNVGFAYARQALRPCRLHGAPDVRGKRKKTKRNQSQKYFFVFAFKHLSGRVKRHSLDLLFRFASRQNERQTSLEVRQ